MNDNAKSYVLYFLFIIIGDIHIQNIFFLYYLYHNYSHIFLIIIFLLITSYNKHNFQIAFVSKGEVKLRKKKLS